MIFWTQLALLLLIYRKTWWLHVKVVIENGIYATFPDLQDDLLKILGEKHRLYDFLSTLSVKCSYLLFNKEHVKEILLEVAVHKSTADMKYKISCMNILVVMTQNSYFLFCR